MAKRRPSGDGMVRKREDGRWEGRIVVGHKENGDPIFQYTHVTGDMQRQASAIVENFIQDIFGEELKPWLNAESAVTAASV